MKNAMQNKIDRIKKLRTKAKSLSNKKCLIDSMSYVIAESIFDKIDELNACFLKEYGQDHFNNARKQWEL